MQQANKQTKPTNKQKKNVIRDKISSM